MTNKNKVDINTTVHKNGNIVRKCTEVKCNGKIIGKFENRYKFK